jgi:murein DD-endopeptidase MepM/ murein hydrolase activator NlpD
MNIFPIQSTKKIVEIDLSRDNPDFRFGSLSFETEELQKRIQKEILFKNGEVGIGGYLEERDLYKRSSVFSEGNRCIHLGVDIWIEAGTKVLSALAGKIHSYGFNNDFGDYGGTIILEHNLEEIPNFPNWAQHIKTKKFYSLYGHLSSKSISNWQIDQKVDTGQIIGEIGDPLENGDWPPHLHFQWIIDLENHIGDYPGVCSKEEIEKYKKNCPEPIWK